MAVSAKNKVNLDGLIPRQDLDTLGTAPASASGDEGGIPVSELAKGKLYLSLLRKPHFQRETDDWDVDNVVTLVKSLRDGHLIPAVIMWRSQSGYMFVIDGAHRLSALIAWVNNDYGDRGISDEHYKFDIPRKQKEIAEECRRRINAEVGTYSALSQALTGPNPTPQDIKWAANIARALTTQWVRGDAAIAAKSFLTINERSVQIDQTEKFMIESGDTPRVLAARALVRRARGHEYWGKFDHATRAKIEERAKQAYDVLFVPEDASPSDSAEFPPAGHASSANGLRLALDVVGLANIAAPQTPSRKQDGRFESVEAEAVDKSGEATAAYLDKTYALVKYIAGQHPGSLGLHPAVYFWGATGSHQPTVFLAVLAFVQELVIKNELRLFTLHRARLEEFLVSNSDIGKFILKKHGGWKRSIRPIKDMLRIILSGLEMQKSDGQIEGDLLKARPDAETAEFQIERDSKRNWKETRSAAKRNAVLASAPRCPICKARMVITQASADHDQRRADGGGDGIENIQLTHQYCNTGFKEFYAQKGEALPEISFPV